MARPKHWTVGERGPRPVDVHVGSRVRMRRTMLGMNQMNLGGLIGPAFNRSRKTSAVPTASAPVAGSS